MTSSSIPSRFTRGLVATASLGALVAGSLAVTAFAANAADELPATFLSTAATTWSYNETGVDPAAGNADRLIWTGVDYDDSTWKSAVGAFGAKSGSATPNLGAAFPVTTVLRQYIDPAATTKVDIPTYHFRSDFSLSAGQLAGISSLTGTVTYDDALQIFVNGTKVAGLKDARVDAVADAQKNLTYAGDSGGDPVTSTFSVPASALHSGVNTVSVALYQDRETSSDIYLDVKSLVPVAKDAVSTTITNLVLGVGADEAQRTLNWYTTANTTQVAQLAPASAMTGEQFPAAATTVPATGGLTTSGEYSRKATLQSLQPNTEYVYRVGTDGNWSAVNRFRTQSFEGDFQFLFLGDPQIGASGNVANDQAGWVDTLNVAQSAYPDSELIFSAGDQVENAGNEAQYDAFLAPEQLRQIPLVVTNGNHDVGSKAYEQHFNVPNNDATAGAGTATSSGGDYWFIYNDVLFLNINSNSRDYAAHNAFLERVVAEQGANATWKVLAFHHSIYSVAAHTADTDILDRRNNMPQTISALGIDLVLQGHDHSYTRSYLVKDGQLADSTEVAGQSEVVAEDGEVLYLTANSASGSKYYSVQAPNAWFASVINQENVRNYSAVEVTADGITVKTMRSQANGTAKPVNSVVDQVTLRKASAPDEQQVQVEVPEGAPGEFVWSVDGTNGLVDLGTAVASGDHFEADGELNPIRVTDTRRGAPEWTVSAQIGDFTSGSTTFSGKYLGWTPKLIEAGGDAVAGEAVASGFDSGNGLSTPATLGRAVGGHLLGSAKLGADLRLKIPVDVTGGTYRATLTLTALS